MSRATQPETMRLTIRDVAFGGEGVARAPDGMIVFVPFTAVGDEIEADIMHRYKNYARAKLSRLLAPSPDRSAPLCPYFGRCGGCQYQHIKYAVQLQLKARQLQGCLKRIAGLDIPEPSIEGSPRHYGYRNKIVLERVARPNGTVEYGFCEIDNRTFFPLRACPIARPALNAELRRLRDRQIIPLSGDEEAPPKLLLRSSATGETYSSFPARVQREKTFLHESLFGKDVSVPLQSFWQVNSEILERLAAEMKQWVSCLKPAFVIDAYAGIGVFSFASATEVPEGYVIERNAAALEVARRNHRGWGAGERRYVSAFAEAALPNILKQSAMQSRSNNLVILDPPRNGCRTPVTRALVRYPARAIIYVSCNPSTLARDVKILCARGPYHLKRLTVFDMFPQTAHFETAALLTTD